MVVLALAATAALLSGCSDATGQLRGGQILVVDPCPPDAGHTWTDLYGCYFGPSGKASCAAINECHGSVSDPGAAFNFVCGHTKEACYQGVINFGAGDAGPMPVPDAKLWSSFLRTPGQASGFMPCNVLALAGNIPTCSIDTAGNSYTFSSDDMKRINAWIAEGAQDN
jgi:hypothetical protein